MSASEDTHSPAALAEQRRELQAQMQRQRSGIARALNVATQGQPASPYPRSRTVRFLKARLAGVDRMVGKALAAMVMARVFGRRSRRDSRNKK